MDIIKETHRIDYTIVTGLVDSSRASELPMRVDKDGWNTDPKEHEKYYLTPMKKRIYRLGSMPVGSGHDCFLKGINVQAYFSMPQYFWQQAKRYNWFDIVSSQSTMHCITKMSIEKQCNKYVFKDTIEKLESLISIYNNWDKINHSSTEDENPKDKKELFQIICSNIPSGLILRAYITTNYLQLKTIYNQRKHHKLEEWQTFIEWCDGLPMFKDLIMKNKDD